MQSLKTRLILLSALSILLFPALGIRSSASQAQQVKTETVVVEQYQQPYTYVVDLGTRDAITRAQVLLHSQGYYHGKVNGVLTGDTRKAIREFQEDHNLRKTGFLDTPTAQLLGMGTVTVSSRGPAVIYDYNSTGSVVRAQSLLRNMGYYHGKITGYYNDDTRDAIKKFQDEHNLRKTGVLDSPTAELLGLDLVTVSNVPTTITRSKVVYDLSSSDVITRAQTALHNMGYFHGDINGVLDDDTSDAIKEFQDDRNLSQTGTLDLETARQLGIIVQIR